MEYDKATVQDISTPECHTFRLMIIRLGSTRIKEIFPATANQATDRHYPSTEVSAEIILYKSCRYKYLLTVFMGKKKLIHYRYVITHHTKGVQSHLSDSIPRISRGTELRWTTRATKMKGFSWITSKPHRGMPPERSRWIQGKTSLSNIERLEGAFCLICSLALYSI